MNRKKILCLTIAVFMLLSIVPLQIFAADGDTAQGDSSVCYVEYEETKNYYDNLNSAIEAAASGSTVVLIKDTEINGYKSFFGKNLTVDGAGFSLTNTAGGYAFDVNKASNGDENYTFTLKNLTLTSGSGIWSNANYINIENCNINVTNAMTISFAGTNGVINFTDSVFNSVNGSATAEPFIRTGSGGAQNLTINMKNSQVNVNNGKTVSPVTENNGVFNIYTTGSFSLNMDSTSRITANSEYTGSIFAMNRATNPSLNLNLAEDATLELENASNGAGFIVNVASYDKISVTDNGAKWVIGAAVANKGVNLPVFYVDGVPCAWNVNGNTVSCYYSDADANGDTVFSHVNGTDADQPINIVDANGNFVKGYQSVNAAFTALNNGEKILVNQDTYMTSTMVEGTYDPDNVRKIVVEGATRADGSKATVYTKAGFADTLSLCELTLKNVKINNLSGSVEMFLFDVWYAGGWKDEFNGGKLIIEDCVLINGASRMIKCRAGASTTVAHDPFYITITDSTINHTGEGTFLYATHYADVRLDVVNSTVTNNGGSIISVDDTALASGSANSSVTASFDNSVINAKSASPAMYLYANGKLLDVTLKNGSAMNHSGSKAVLQSDGANAETVRIALDNSKILSTSSFPVGYMGEKTQAKNLEFTLKNNSYLEQIGGSGSQWYSWLFMLEPNSVGSTFNLNIDATSEIFANMTSAGTCAGIIYGCLASTINVNLEKGATIGLESKAANVYFFNGSETAYLSAKGTLNLNDNGAIYKVGETAVTTDTSGVNLPSVIKDKTLIGYAKDGVVYKNVVTVAGYYTTVAYGADDFYMTDGAALRTQDGSGIRFTTNVSADIKNGLGSNVAFGTLIGNASMLTADDVVAAPTLDGGDAVVNIAQKTWYKDTNTYNAALINIPDTAYAYQVKLAGRGYMTVTYADGSAATFYTSFNENDNVRSMYDVATNLTDAGKGTAVTAAIIYAVNA